MKGSIKIATMFGIPVKLHWSFGLLMLYIVYDGYTRGMPWEGIALMSLFLISIFICVVLHEYGHALTARRYGVETRDIILSPIGGVARLEKLPEKPMQEFYVAIAGPLVNIAIVIIIIPIITLLFQKEISWDMNFIESLYRMIEFDHPFTVFPILLLGNIALAGFNLLPAFPMDGGRIFRSLLSIKLGRLRATQIASYLGNLFGIGMIIYGIYEPAITTAFIGAFVFFLASQEYRMVKMETVLKNHSVADLFRSNFTKLLVNSKMSEAEDHIKRNTEKNFLVFDTEGNLAGVLHELFIMEAIRKNDLSGPVVEYLSQSYESIDLKDNLEHVLKIMQEHGYSILPVYDNEELVGVIDVSMMNNFLRMKKRR